MKTKVTLSFGRVTLGDKPYRIEKIINDIALSSGGKRYDVGDYITNEEAANLDPGIEITTIARKE